MPTVDPDCVVCGAIDPDRTIGFGAFGWGGAVGISMCGVCWDAARWHDENTPKSRCVSCGQPSSKKIELHLPIEDSPGYTVAFCGECRVAFPDMHRTDTTFRARANINKDWENQRKAALKRDNGHCQSCGLTDARLHVHHIIPQEEGGTDHLDNLRTLCPPCHANVHYAEACLLCGTIVHSDDCGATWTDTSGGSYCVFCEDCRDYIKSGGVDGERCNICARFKDSASKSDCIGFFADYPDPSYYAACDDCRDKIIFGDWSERQHYLDQFLPDTHVNVRHWEVVQGD